MSDHETRRAWELLEKVAGEYKPEWKDQILEHARIVRDVSLFLAGLFPNENSIDLKIIELGAILHDVGRSRSDRVVEHGVKSGEIIREQGFPETVARIGETHIGVGIARTEASSLGLPERDFIPKTLEERIVCYADNLLYYLPEQGHHELKDTDTVVERFSEELGENYGMRARDFMERVESEVGHEGFQRFRKYVDDVNKKPL
ncbi:MAG: HD domain-containing protein [Candidatus Hydrothermarchaeaceae archaeon]